MTGSAVATSPFAGSRACPQQPAPLGRVRSAVAAYPALRALRAVLIARLARLDPRRTDWRVRARCYAVEPKTGLPLRRATLAPPNRHGGSLLQRCGGPLAPLARPRTPRYGSTQLRRPARRRAPAGWPFRSQLRPLRQPNRRKFLQATVFPLRRSPARPSRSQIQWVRIRRRQLLPQS